MVTVFLRGGLGNQMFQYAAGLALAKKNNTELVLDTVFLNDRFPRRNFTYRTFDLDIFTLEPHLTGFSKCSAGVPVPGLWLGMDLVAIKACAVLERLHVVREKAQIVFDPAMFGKKGNIFLWGRWQNEKYFAGIADDVRSAFAFRNPLVGEAAAIADNIRSSNTVSVHVRRGDFVALKNVVQFMGSFDRSYYDRAFAHIAAHIDNPTFFVFSDDIDWCRENFKTAYPMVYVPASAEGPKAAFHLELMSLCRHNITANSTFSWWGAWLNKNPRKIVITPKQWYRDGRDETDVVPGEWIRI